MINNYDKFATIVSKIVELSNCKDYYNDIKAFENALKESKLGIGHFNWDDPWNIDYSTSSFYTSYYDGNQAPFEVCSWNSDLDSFLNLLKNTSERLYQECMNEYTETEELINTEPIKPESYNMIPKNKYNDLFMEFALVKNKVVNILNLYHQGEIIPLDDIKGINIDLDDITIYYEDYEELDFYLFDEETGGDRKGRMKVSKELYIPMEWLFLSDEEIKEELKKR